MEEILDVYCETYDQRHPLIAMDEAAKQVTGDWQRAANAERRGICWRFTTTEARVKLKCLYPTHDN